jgi:hypothetical protein
MFLCDECLTKDYTNARQIRPSFGKCESCGLLRPCSDIPARYLRLRRANAQSPQPAAESREEPQRKESENS